MTQQDGQDGQPTVETAAQHVIEFRPDGDTWQVTVKIPMGADRVEQINEIEHLMLGFEELVRNPYFAAFLASIGRKCLERVMKEREQNA